MIKNFRIEAEKPTREEAIEQATLIGSQFIGLLKIMHDQRGEWECTDDVTSRSDTGYTNRMKFVYRGEQ
jgi:hypothetical protein